MTLLRFDPIRQFEKVAQKMNEYVNEFGKGVNIETGGFKPRVDIVEDAKSVIIHADLPGLTKEDVKISVSDENLLTIKGEKRLAQQPQDRTFLRTERVYGSFNRSFVLPDNLDKENVNAKYENGVLEIILSKVEPPQPKEIEVRIS